MKLIEITKSKITKNENDENVPYLKITKVVLIHCSNINNSYSTKFQSLVYICS